MGALVECSTKGAQYVRTCLRSRYYGSYEAIPLELNAYTLEGRFEQNPAKLFSVADEVRRWVVANRF